MGRQFIADCDEANNEVARLDAELAKAKADEDAATAMLAEAQSELITLAADKTKAEEALAAANTELAGKAKTLAETQKSLVAAKGEAVKQIAAAGVSAARQNGTSGHDGIDGNGGKKLTGLQRSIAANVAAFEAKAK